MEDIERIKERLENIRSVEPIVGSLRTIAAGGWRLAVRRLEASAEYAENLAEMLAALLSETPAGQIESAFVTLVPKPPLRPAMLVVASERGLCGAFNDIVLEGADRLIAQEELHCEQVQVIALGSRAERYFHRRGRTLLLGQPLPVTHVVTFDMVRGLADTLKDLLASGVVDAVNVIYSPYKAGITLAPSSRRWLPIDASSLPRKSPRWLRPIIETGKDALLRRALDEWALVQFFHLLMESAASEQNARFRAMDAATSNLHRLIEELTRGYHMARQHAITMEMLDLVAGSGILRGPRGRQRR